jgi:type VI secretion system protein ImpF
MDASIERLRTKVKEEARYKPYVLRRLTDFDPSAKKETTLHTITIGQVKEDIFDNIAMLFNSRSFLLHDEDTWPEEVEASVLGYGLPDYCGKSYSMEERERLRSVIARQLQIFEPRLDPESIRVDFLESPEVPSFLIDFRVSGLIRVGEVSEEVLFVSRLNLETGNTEIKSLTG